MYYCFLVVTHLGRGYFAMHTKYVLAFFLVVPSDAPEWKSHCAAHYAGHCLLRCEHYSWSFPPPHILPFQTKHVLQSLIQFIVLWEWLSTKIFRSFWSKNS